MVLTPDTNEVDHSTAPARSTEVLEPALDRTELVARLRARDESAAEELLREFAPGLFLVARSILGCEHAAQDAVQEGIVSALRAIDSLKEPNALGAWLRRTVSNAALAGLRRDKRRRERHIDDLLPRFLDDGHRADVGPAWAPDCSTAQDRREMISIVREAMDELPERYREMLLLRDVLGLDTQGAAEAMEITPTNAKVMLHRERQALRTVLEERLTCV